MGAAPGADPLRPVAGVVLAAGGGRRMGMPKALVELDGDRWSAGAVDTLRDGGCDPVAVVVGARADEVAAAAGRRDG
jgi:CTP:molybdopterin cytidylyltransferase MocA